MSLLKLIGIPFLQALSNRKVLTGLHHEEFRRCILLWLHMYYEIPEACRVQYHDVAT